MRFSAALGIMTAAAALWASSAHAAGWEEGNCALFRGVGVCSEHGHLVFENISPVSGVGDTLCIEVSSGRLFWSGGPFKALAQTQDMVVTASSFAAVGYREGVREGIHYWNRPLKSAEQMQVPQDWGTVRPAKEFGPIQPFPERYHRLADGTVVFLQDAENPPRERGPWYDLHLRLSSTTEWLAARNLRPRSWVLNADTTGWAMAAVQWEPDFGGRLTQVVLAGVGQQSERFELHWDSALWERGQRLWGLDPQGEITTIEPGPGAWKVRKPQAPGHTCGHGPDAPETKWTWMLPRSFATYQQAEEYGYTLPAVKNNPRWIKRTGTGYQVCLGSAENEKLLRNAIQDPPVPGAKTKNVTVWDSQYTGVPTHFASSDLGGEVSLRYLQNDTCRVSELWWRFHGNGNWVKLAGPWSH